MNGDGFMGHEWNSPCKSGEVTANKPKKKKKEIVDIKHLNDHSSNFEYKWIQRIYYRYLFAFICFAI